MNHQVQTAPAGDVARLIHSIRGQRVILDADLAKIYGVETRAINQALKRNQERFPEDFAFELTREEILGISQTVIFLHTLKFSKPGGELFPGLHQQDQAGAVRCQTAELWRAGGGAVA